VDSAVHGLRRRQHFAGGAQYNRDRGVAPMSNPDGCIEKDPIPFRSLTRPDSSRLLTYLSSSMRRIWV
jgi:hypothetical protein